MIAWVGFDDNRDLNLYGARSALRIWTEFMLKAYQLYPVRDAAGMSFTTPPGIEIVSNSCTKLNIQGVPMSGMVEGCPIKLKDERSLVLCVRMSRDHRSA